MLLTKALTDYENHQRSMKTLSQTTTLPNYLALLREFVRWIEAEGIEEQTTPPRAPVIVDLTPTLFVRYFDHVAARVPKKCGPVRAAVRSFCKYLIRMKRIEVDITTGVQLPTVDQSRRVAPTEEAIDRMIAAVETMQTTERKRHLYRAVLYLLVFVGLRAKEVVELRVQDIDREKKRIFVCLGKGNRERYVKAPAEFWPVISDYLKQRPTSEFDRLLLYSSETRIGYKSVGGILDNILEAAGLEEEGITPHCLRHYFACNGETNGAPLRVIAAQLGHASVTTTAIYLRTPQVVSEDQASAFGRSSKSQAQREAEEQEAIDRMHGRTETQKPAVPEPVRPKEPERPTGPGRDRQSARDSRFRRYVVNRAA